MSSPKIIIGHVGLSFPSVSKQVFVRNHEYENEFLLKIYSRENENHLYVKYFARRLLLKQRDNVTRKWQHICQPGKLSW